MDQKQAKKFMEIKLKNNKLIMLLIFVGIYSNLFSQDSNVINCPKLDTISGVIVLKFELKYHDLYAIQELEYYEYDSLIPISDTLLPFRNMNYSLIKSFMDISNCAEYSSLVNDFSQDSIGSLYNNSLIKYNYLGWGNDYKTKIFSNQFYIDSSGLLLISFQFQGVVLNYENIPKIKGKRVYYSTINVKPVSTNIKEKFKLTKSNLSSIELVSLPKEPNIEIDSVGNVPVPFRAKR